ncbi:GspH/FimT family pseudopilin [Glaciecola siphonariae]|uniref:Type II secretion system protein H n=1 Tax=Glaciecola siphonariae TaxID=521012 RepID=A0ABV9LSR8_9ALTE
MNIEQGFARPQYGLSLLEMIIVLAIVSILLSAVGPSATAIVDKSRITAQVNLLSAMLRYTRAQAIDEHQSIALCPSADLSQCDINDWSLPKMVFDDKNFNQYRDEEEALIYVTEKIPTGVILQGPKKLIRFYEDGTIGSPATLRVCPTRENATLNRALIISLQGRVRVSTDTNNDDIHELGSGDAVTCIS